MREIKFRMWDSLRNVYEDFFNTYTFWEKRTLNTIQDYLILEQYTGLKDKNGKEIYEGDIAEDSTGRVTVTATVIYIGSSFCFGFYNDYLDEWAERIEIIGNIHEEKK